MSPSHENLKDRRGGLAPAASVPQQCSFLRMWPPRLTASPQQQWPGRHTCASSSPKARDSSPLTHRAPKHVLHVGGTT